VGELIVILTPIRTLKFQASKHPGSCSKHIVNQNQAKRTIVKRYHWVDSFNSQVGTHRTSDLWRVDKVKFHRCLCCSCFKLAHWNKGRFAVLGSQSATKKRQVLAIFQPQASTVDTASSSSPPRRGVQDRSCIAMRDPERSGSLKGRHAVCTADRYEGR
jgi:hypothetical protein